MLYFLIFCAVIYFLFFHENNALNSIAERKYTWERVGGSAYISQSLPQHVTSATYVCYIKHCGNFIKSYISYFNDEQGRFVVVAHMNKHHEICLAIPLGSLDLPKNTDIDVEIEIHQHIEQFGRVNTSVANISRTFYMDKDPFYFIQWLEPALQIQSYFALYYNQNNKHENWQSDYVKIIKSTYADVIKNNNNEVIYLRNSLKSLANVQININESIREYNRRCLYMYMSDILFASLIDLMVIKIKNQSVFDINQACDEIRKYGVMLEVNREIMDNGINFLKNIKHDYGYCNSNNNHNYNNSHNRNSNYNNNNPNKNDVEWALGVLGVSKDTTQADMKKAYRKKISEIHPDKYQELPESVKEILEQTAQDLNKAKEILGF